MFGLEGVFDAQRNVVLAQALGSARVNSLHSQVGQLVGHIVIGAADGDDILLTDHCRIGGAEVVLLVDDRLAGTRHHRDATEGHFAVTAIEARHQSLTAVGVAGDDGQLPVNVDIAERLFNDSIKRLCFDRIPAGEIDKTGVDPLQLQQPGGVPGAMCLADAG